MVGTAELKKLADSVEIIKMLCYILHLNGYLSYLKLKEDG